MCHVSCIMCLTCIMIMCHVSCIIYHVSCIMYLTCIMIMYLVLGNNGGPILHAKSFSFFVSDLELFIRKKVRPSISAAKNAAARESAVAKSAAALALALGEYHHVMSCHVIFRSDYITSYCIIVSFLFSLSFLLLLLLLLLLLINLHSILFHSILFHSILFHCIYRESSVRRDTRCHQHHTLRS